jgi:hypothetical protein
MSQFDWPIAKKRGGLELWRLHQNRRFYGKMECLPLWPTYIGEKGRTLDKTYGIKASCYWERPWGTNWEPMEHIANLLWIHWELEGDMLGTKEKWKKSSPPPHAPKLKRKKSRHFECMLSLPIGYMKFLCSKTVCHHFWPGLISPL